MDLMNDNIILYSNKNRNIFNKKLPIILTIQNTNSLEHIFVTLVLRKMLYDLIEKKEYGLNIRNIISFTNAFSSNNIPMLEVETHRIEKAYDNNFVMHPLMYFQILTKFSNTALTTFRTLIANDINDSDQSTLDILNKWLIMTNIDKYREAITHVYASE